MRPQKTLDCTAALQQTLQLCGVLPPLYQPPRLHQVRGGCHEPRVEMSREFVEPTGRIVEFSNENATKKPKPSLRTTIQSFTFGYNRRKYDDHNPSNLRYVPVDHCYEEWREK